MKTVLISQGVFNLGKPPVVPARLLLEREIGAFRSVVFTMSFEDIFDATSDYAHDDEVYAEKAAQIFRQATTREEQIVDWLDSFDFLCLTQSEWDTIDAKWFLEHYLLPLLDETTNQRARMLIWHEDGQYWA